MLYIFQSFVLTLYDASVLQPAARNRCDLVMPLDISKYTRFVEGFDLSGKQKRELIQAVWQIMESFVDRGWGIHPLQQGSGKAIDKDCLGRPSSIESQDSNSKTFIGKSVSPTLESKTDS